MSVYPFIEAEKVEQRNVNKACVLLKVSSSAFYEWAKHIPCQRELSDEELLGKIKAIHAVSDGTYGSPRVHAQLKADGEVAGKNRVATLMQEHGIVGRSKRCFNKTTNPDPDATPTAMNLLKRVFGPEGLQINRAWVGDISYVRTWEGWLYVASVIDLGSRRVVGWAMADHMRASLVCDALSMAIDRRRPDAGLIFHSDRGSQYTSADFAKLLDRNEIVQSLSRPGQVWDNAVAESFFATLKCELVHLRSWPTRAHARRAIFEYIEGWYNRRRLHSSLGYMSPQAFESNQIARGIEDAA